MICINVEEIYASCVPGSSIFGGLLDRCTISPFDVVYIKNKQQVIDGFMHFISISSIDNSSTVASYAVHISFCRDGQPNYRLQLMHIEVKKGDYCLLYHLGR